jgi:hypothetical protein
MTVAASCCLNLFERRGILSGAGEVFNFEPDPLRGARRSLMLRRMRNRIMLAAMLVVSLLCVVGFARQAQEPRPRWEYRSTCHLIELNRLGEEGWELSAATQDGNTTCFYFKRQK